MKRVADDQERSESVRRRNEWSDGVTRALRLFVLSWTLTSGPAWASSPDSVDTMLRDVRPGDVVRVFAKNLEEPVIGRHVSASSETLRVKPATLPAVPIARQDVVQLEISPERTRATWLGALLGGIMGGALTMAMVASNENSEGPVALVGIVFVPVGLGMGALLGSGIVDYHWRTVWERP